MPVNLAQYWGAVGNFNNQKFFNAKAGNAVCGHRYWMPTNSGTVLLLLIITHCAAWHKNRKTSNNLCRYTSFQYPLFSKVTIVIDCNYVTRWRWKQSIFAHNFAKMFLLKAYVVIHKFDRICLSETYLDSSLPTNNEYWWVQPGLLCSSIKHETWKSLYLL